MPITGEILTFLTGELIFEYWPFRVLEDKHTRFRCTSFLKV